MDDQQTAKLLMSEFVTQDVKRFIVTKPEKFSFRAGQAVELAINKPHWKNEGRPFTPTNLATDKVLEFTVKQYPDHDGVTKALHQLQSGDELLISPAFGTISFQGPGVFLAGGAGITPFIAILREQMQKGTIGESTLIFSNKTPSDIIVEKELLFYMQENCLLTCTQKAAPGYQDRRIDKAFLANHIKDFQQPFYVCGPESFMENINSALADLGAKAENIIFEQ